MINGTSSLALGMRLVSIMDPCHIWLLLAFKGNNLQGTYTTRCPKRHLTYLILKDRQTYCT